MVGVLRAPSGAPISKRYCEPLNARRPSLEVAANGYTWRRTAVTQQITPFSFESHSVRVIESDDGPWFVLRDVLQAMQSATTANKAKASITEGLGDGWFKSTPILDSMGRTQETTLINEPAVTFLVARSNTEVGRKLNRWIHAEVIPAIRKTGAYGAGQPPEVAALDITPKAMAAAQAFGFTGNQATLSADNAVKAITGVSALGLMGRTHLAAPEQEVTCTPTEIGKLMEPAKSGASVNRALCDLGLQAREANRWIPTQEGLRYCEVLDTGKRHSTGAPVKQVKWSRSVLSLLQQAKAA
jgi:prophage antirepressor-like protein